MRSLDNTSMSVEAPFAFVREALGPFVGRPAARLAGKHEKRRQGVDNAVLVCLRCIGGSTQSCLAKYLEEDRRASLWTRAHAFRHRSLSVPLSSPVLSRCLDFARRRCGCLATTTTTTTTDPKISWIPDSYITEAASDVVSGMEGLGRNVWEGLRRRLRLRDIPRTRGRSHLTQPPLHPERVSFRSRLGQSPLAASVPSGSLCVLLLICQLFAA